MTGLRAGARRGVLFVTPRLGIQKGDFLGSGVPYWPLEAATLAARVREDGTEVGFWDLFGLDPFRLESDGGVYWQGLPVHRAAEGRGRRPPESYDCAIVYALSAMSHREVLGVASWLKGRGCRRVVAMENSQAVTGYDLSEAADELRKAGADYLLLGEPYGNWGELRAFLLDGSGGRPANLVDLGRPHPPARRLYADPARTPVPAWDLVPFENYWRLPYSHGPGFGRYFPILTSRGCPYPCTFCVVPATNERSWRPRPAEDVVGEMLELSRRFGVARFHWEDLNPTIDPRRTRRIARLLAESGGSFRFSLASGTKAETLDEETLDALARAGCDYISISPESGSARILDRMRKPFDHARGLAVIRAMRARGIRSQACFVLGHPEEGAADRRATERYVRAVALAGADEAAFFILSPLPGSRLASRIPATGEPRPFWSFTPLHRSDFRGLQRWRRRLIRDFLLWRLLRHPLGLCRQALNALLRRPRTKMEMLPRRMLAVWWMSMRAAGR